MGADYISIHPDNPQARLIRRACDIIRQGRVAVIPTDSAYAMCCLTGEKSAVERIARIRNISRTHNFTLLCRDLSELSTYARVSNSIYRLLRHNTPGPYTFILPATREVPRLLLNARRRTIGLRVPRGAIIEALLEEMGQPLMSCTLILPEEEEPESDPVEINTKIGTLVDVIVDGGQLPPLATTVVSFDEDGVPEVRRRGLGDPAPFE